MKICSLRNKHYLSRCVFSDILNRKFPTEKTVSPCAECVTFYKVNVKQMYEKVVARIISRQNLIFTGKFHSSCMLILVDHVGFSTFQAATAVEKT